MEIKSKIIKKNCIHLISNIRLDIGCETQRGRVLKIFFFFFVTLYIFAIFIVFLALRIILVLQKLKTKKRFLQAWYFEFFVHSFEFCRKLSMLILFVEEPCCNQHGSSTNRGRMIMIWKHVVSHELIMVFNPPT